MKVPSMTAASVTSERRYTMQLNLPVLDQISSCRNLLIAGMGGGFDIFCGLPVYFELQRRGQRVHLGSFSFSDIAGFSGGVRLTDTLVGVTAEYEGLVVYFPELYLAQWFKEKRGEEITVWAFHKTGARPLSENYKVLVEHLDIDGILLMDGGVDSLMRGDEARMGTFIEDAFSLFAVNELRDVPVRLLGCVGFGAEEGVAHAHVFENIAALATGGAFLGSCSLVKQMECYQAYREAVLYVQGRRYQDPSVINSSIISAVDGHYGDYHLTDKTKRGHLWISPLMPIYWFFDLPAVAERSFLLSQLRGTQTFLDGVQLMKDVLSLIPRRDWGRIPLP
jgi:hypothetical protein